MVRRLVAPPDAERTLGSASPWLSRMCLAASDALAASGVGVSVMSDEGALGVAAASDGVTRRLGELQFSLGEGPCIDAFTDSRPVLVPDLTRRKAGRWPGYAATATSLGVRAVFSFPLSVGAARLGAMDVYRREVGALSEGALGLALAFADVTVESLLDSQAGIGATGATADGLAAVLDPNYVVYQAQGMTMVDLGVTLADALARLRAHAFAENRPLAEVARDVVEGRLRLQRDTNDGAGPADDDGDYSRRSDGHG
jgi:ANTAR domain/GAF domain